MKKEIFNWFGGWYGFAGVWFLLLALGLMVLSPVPNCGCGTYNRIEFRTAYEVLYREISLALAPGKSCSPYACISVPRLIPFDLLFAGILFIFIALAKKILKYQRTAKMLAIAVLCLLVAVNILRWMMPVASFGPVNVFFCSYLYGGEESYLARGACYPQNEMFTRFLMGIVPITFVYLLIFFLVRVRRSEAFRTK